MTTEAVAVPRFELSRVLNYRMKILHLMRDYHGFEIDAVVVDELCGKLSTLYKHKIQEHILRESSRNLYSPALTEKASAEFAWRIAGNERRLRDGQVVHPWSNLVADEWMALQVLRVVEAAPIGGKSQLTFTVFALAGSAAGHTFQHRWSAGFCAYASRHVGFSAVFRDRPYSAPQQFVGLRLIGHMELQSDGQARVGAIASNSACQKWNLGILDLRCRKQPCPRGWTHPCHKCVVGYVDCKAGTHRDNYTTAVCAECQQEAPHDPQDSGGCLNCNRRRRLART